MWLTRTSDADYDALCQMRHRSIDVHVLKEMQLAFNQTTKEWMLPVWGADGHSRGIVNLYVWRAEADPSSNKIRRSILSGPTFKHHPYGVHRLRDGSQRPIWVLEGQWDYLAFNTLLHRVGQAPQADTLGVPGAGTFPRNSLSVFNGRAVYLVFDNDEAGRTGMEGLLVQMNRNHIFPTSVYTIRWPEDLPVGFDVSDAITKLGRKYCKKVKV